MEEKKNNNEEEEEEEVKENEEDDGNYDNDEMNHGKQLVTTTTGGGGGSNNTVMTLPATVSQCSLTSSIYSSNNHHTGGRVSGRRSGGSGGGVRLLRRRQVQVQLLGGISGMSCLVLLVSCLNGLALISLCIMMVSTILLVQGGIEYIQLQYQLNPRLIYDMLPSSLQSYLTSTTLHEWMTSTEGSPYMEYRYLLLYFIPGLTEPQLQRLLLRLPPRHRDLLFQPGGIPRILLPPSLYNLLSPTPMEEQEEQSSLLAIQEQEQEPPTVQDAIQGILGTVRELFPHYSSPSTSTQQPPIINTNTITPIENDMTWEEEDEEYDATNNNNVMVQSPPTTVNAVYHTEEEEDDASTRRHLQYQEEYATEEAILTDEIGRASCRERVC